MVKWLPGDSVVWTWEMSPFAYYFLDIFNISVVSSDTRFGHEWTGTKVWFCSELFSPHSHAQTLGDKLQVPSSGLPYQELLNSLREWELAASHYQGSQGARPCSAFWPLKACGDFWLDLEPVEGRQIRRAMREHRDRVRNLHSFIGNRCPVEVESRVPASGQCAWQALLLTTPPFSLLIFTPAGTTRLWRGGWCSKWSWGCWKTVFVGTQMCVVGWNTQRIMDWWD